MGLESASLPGPEAASAGVMLGGPRVSHGLGSCFMQGEIRTTLGTTNIWSPPSLVPAPLTPVKPSNDFSCLFLCLFFKFKARLRYMFRNHFLFQKGQDTVGRCNVLFDGELLPCVALSAHWLCDSEPSDLIFLCFFTVRV